MSARPATRFAALGAAGFVGYVAYPRVGCRRSVGVAAVPLAVGAGVASFFSPCSFPLLLTLLARRREQVGAFLAAVAVRGVRASLVERLRGGSAVVKRGGGYVLIVVGVWFVASAIAADAFARGLPV